MYLGVVVVAKPNVAATAILGRLDSHILSKNVHTDCARPLRSSLIKHTLAIHTDHALCEFLCAELIDIVAWIQWPEKLCSKVQAVVGESLPTDHVRVPGLVKVQAGVGSKKVARILKSCTPSTSYWGRIGGRP